MASSRPHILIVEDDAELAGRIGLFLSGQGYQVDHAADGSQALSKIRLSRPDVVILDAVLPKFSGFQIGRLIKFDPNFNKVPILMLTILDQPADRERAKAVGINLFLTKPFTDDALLKAVKKLLESEGG